jgi:hypothetical protein
MSPKNAWMTFSMLVVLGDIVGMMVLVDLGYPEMVVFAVGPVLLLLYFYVLYKRYHVEVVPESDIPLFTDPDDLRILCRIYGLEEGGPESDLRERLMTFSRENSLRPFAWVAPGFVQSLGAALEIPEVAQGTDDGGGERPLTGGRARSGSRLMGLCPVCDADLPAGGTVCAECGADLEFYTVLRESKVGRRLVSEKARVVKRKLRYDIPALGEKR